MAKMKGGQIVAECFEKLGIEYYFGYNGHGIWNILDALIDKPHIKGIQPKHEITAVHMADGYFRAKHKVAPVMASVGPGTLHLIPALGNAMLDSSGGMDRGAGEDRRGFAPDRASGLPGD